jgi:hypothetical protein
VWRLANIAEESDGAPCPTEAELRDIYDTCLRQHLPLVGAHALRHLVGAAIETLLQCDRGLFLAESIPDSASKEVNIAPLFDPKISPRTFAITAFK